MNYRNNLLAFFVTLFLGSSGWGQDVYTIDPAHTTIGFSVRHLMINNVKGRFNTFSGTLRVNNQDFTKSSVTVTIDAASIDTGIAKRDEHLRSADFFDVQKYPTITFQSDRIEKRKKGKNWYVAVGTFTLHGVSKEISLPFQITKPIQDPMGKRRVGVMARLTINRHDYGISWGAPMEGGGVAIGDQVKIEIDLEAVQEIASSSTADPAAPRTIRLHVDGMV